MFCEQWLITWLWLMGALSHTQGMHLESPLALFLDFLFKLPLSYLAPLLLGYKL